MREQITCLGEALIDLFPAAGGEEARWFQARPGGSLLNTAVALGRLGTKAVFAGAIGTDRFGRLLRDHLAAEGLDARFLATVAAPTALAFVDLAAAEPAFAFYGADAADAQLAPAHLSRTLLDDTRALHVGSLTLLRERGRAAVVHAVRQLRGRALISVDPNIRPTLIADAAEHRAFLFQLFGQVDLVKASAADLRWLSPGIPLSQAAEKILAAGPQLVVVTQGERGVFGLLRGPTGSPLPIQVPPVSVPVVDTVGAGDVFTAGLLAHLATEGCLHRGALPSGHGALAAALRFAAAAAAVCCTRVGCDPPRHDEVIALLGRDAEDAQP